MAAGDITVVIKQVTVTEGTTVDNSTFFTAAEIPAAFTDKTITVKERSTNNNVIVYDVIATAVANA